MLVTKYLMNECSAGIQYISLSLSLSFKRLHTTVYKIDNQQRPTAQHRELINIL